MFFLHALRLPQKRCVYSVADVVLVQLFQWYKLRSKFIWGDCFQLNLIFFCSDFIFSNISSLI